MVQQLYLPPNIYDTLITTCVDAQPDEVCGFLIGDVMSVSAIQPMDQDNGSLLHQVSQIQTTGLTVIGLFHSRLTAPPIPAPSQINELTHLNLCHLFVSLKTDRPSVGAWYITDETVEHVPISFDLERLDTASSSTWTQNQNIAMILFTVVSIIGLIILSIILLPPAP